MTLIIGSLASPPVAWVYNVKDYGAVGDDSHDDTAAIQAAVNALKANTTVAQNFGGQDLFFPPGVYKTTSQLDFTGLQQVRISGFSARGYTLGTFPRPAPTIHYKTVDGSTVVNLADCQGIVWDGVSVVSTGTVGYSGTLMSFDSSIADNTFGNRIQNMALDAANGTGPTLLGLAGAIEFSADNVTFKNAPAGSQVRMLKAGAPAGWSNANSFSSCSFLADRANSVLNPSVQTSFFDCTFEQTPANAAAPILSSIAGSFPANSVNFYGCGFWDVSSGSIPWMKATVATSAWGLYGCFGVISPTNSFFELQSHAGLVVQSCRFESVSGTPNLFNASYPITKGQMSGCVVDSHVVDNHASVFVGPTTSSASSLSLGTAYQNTLGYDVMISVFLSVTANVSGVISLGVGSTSTPTQQVIVTGISATGLFTVPIYLPANSFALLSVSGTITDAIVGQIAMPTRIA